MKIFLVILFFGLSPIAECQSIDTIADYQHVDTIKVRKDEDVIHTSGGPKEMIRLINQNLRWPAPDWLGEGTVYVRFIVDTLGFVRFPFIVKGLDSLANTSVLRAINMLPQLAPALSKGKPVKVYYTIPVRFKIN